MSGWLAGSPAQARETGVSHALRANSGAPGVFEISFKPPRDYPEAYKEGFNSHYKR